MIVVPVALSIIVAIFIALSIFQSRKQEAKVLEESKPTVVHLDAASTALDVDQLWRNKVEDNVTDQKKNLDQSLASAMETLSEKLLQSDAKTEDEIRALKEKLKFLEAEARDGDSDDPSSLSLQVSPPPAIMRYQLHLNNAKNQASYLPLKTNENFISAGSFAKGVLLSGVDASTASRALSDPEPVLIRVVDHGTLPRRFKSDLKDCHIIGSAFGDLSSERAKIRLEKLSCTEIKTGEVVETEVAGYVAGEDGRSGLRGTIVSVDQKYLINAQMFGTLAGFASTSAKDPTSYNPFTIGQGTVKPMGDGARAKNSLLGGASNSLDRLADYYIDRAESIQPVIQVGAGRKIDVVFTEGVYFGTSSLKKHLAKKRDEQIKKTSENESKQFLEQ
jgi:conjugal transfer pilus assembly protein TraB